jgi:hypothetical protein
MIRPNAKEGIEYEIVVCHAVPQGGYDRCQQLSSSMASKGSVRVYLTAHGRGKAVCLEDVTGRYGHRLVEKTIELKTDGIGVETDIAAGLFMYKPDGSYSRCTTAE